MAKQNKARLNQPGDKKSYSRIQWFLFVIMIPLLFALSVALVVMTIAGVNVFDKAKEISASLPYVSEWAETAEQDGKTDSEQAAELQAELKNKEAEIEQLSGELQSAEAEIEELLTEQDRLNAQLQQLEQQTAEAPAQGENAENQLAETYETMDEKSIAGIVINLTNTEAVSILRQLSIEKQAAVLETLAAEKAAEYTKLLSNG